MDIHELRKEIDGIDEQLVKLFVARMQVSGQVAQYKKERGLPILVPAREAEKLEAVAQLAGSTMADYTKDLYEKIFELSRAHQEKLNKPLKCGLLGRKLAHSYSPQIHAMMGEYSYELFEKEPEEVADFVLHGDYDAMNVTIPYKKDVLPYLDEIDPIAKRLGSVNTIVRRNGKLCGYNTDYYGFHSMVLRSGIDVAGKKTLVLGSGGTSVTAQAVLKDMGAEVVVISRTGENNYENLNRHHDAKVIVNTTPVGMYPGTGVAPLEIEHFPQLEGVLDVIYNPSRTLMLLDAENLFLPCENGLWMLVAQAKLASELFTGNKLEDSIIAKIHHRLKNQMENIVLVGMPGCGKTSIGQELAKRTGKFFRDSDAEILSAAGRSIPSIFEAEGEEAFRDYETKALIALGKQSGLVIATGGGCVTQLRNYPFLHQNATIIWIRRDVDKLPTEGRPLSLQNDLKAMERKRAPLYKAFADITIDNDSTIEAAVDKILAALEERK